MKIINFWVPVLIIAFDILPLFNWVIYDYNGIDVTVSNIGFFQEIDIEWKNIFHKYLMWGECCYIWPIIYELTDT